MCVCVYSGACMLSLSLKKKIKQCFFKSLRLQMPLQVGIMFLMIVLPARVLVGGDLV